VKQENDSKRIHTRVLIVGAGLTGLSAAFRLSQDNQDFLVLDKKSEYGGVIRSVHKGEFLFEKGPNSGVVANETVVRMFDELGDRVQLEVAGDAAKKRFVLKNKRWHALPSSPISAVKTPLFSWKDKFRILLEPLRKKGRDENESLKDLVLRRLGKSFYHYAVDPFVLGIYAGDPEKLITKYAMPKLYNLEQQYGSFIKGAIKKKKEPKTELQKRVNRRIFSARGGLSQLTSALYQAAGADHFTLGVSDLKISKASPNEKGKAGFAAEFVQNGNRIELTADQVIYTGPAYELSHLLPSNWEEQPAVSDLFYAPTIEIALGFNQWNGISLDGFGGLIPHREGRDILGVLFMSSLFEGRAPRGGALFSVFMGGVRRAELTNLEDPEIRALVEKEFKELMGLEEFKPELFEIIRHQQAIPQYGIESGPRFAAAESLEKNHPGLQIGGNLKGGIGMADRIQQGYQMAEKALG
jgi:oxygen-dependent protoporphyrinogen oxidase